MQKYIFFLYLNHRIYKKGRKAVIHFFRVDLSVNPTAGFYRRLYTSALRPFISRPVIIGFKDYLFTYADDLPLPTFSM